MAFKSFKYNGSFNVILILWDNVHHSCINHFKGSFMLLLNFKSIKDHYCWFNKNLWSPKRSDIANLWTDLYHLATICSNVWLIDGGFNVFRHKDETTANNNNFIQNHSLLDPPLSNNKYTQLNLRINSTCSRSDRFLYSKQ